MLDMVRNKALTNCFVSYRVRELIFCKSPALIALAAFDKAMRNTAATEGIITKFTTLRDMLEQTLPAAELAQYGKTPEEREVTWQKVDVISAKINESIKNTRSNKKIANKILETIINSKWYPTTGLGGAGA